MIWLLAPQVLAGSGYAVVLLYHRFGDVRYPSTSVSMEDFERQMRFLKENNYRVISLSELNALVSSRNKIPPKTVVITIDDGYKTTMKAFEVLKKYGFPFTVFLYMEAIDRYPDFLTQKDIEELKSSCLVEFGNHLYSHPDLALNRLKLSKNEYLNLLKREEKLSRRRFKRLLGYEPTFLAFPYGGYDRLSLKFFSGLYRLLLTQDRGSYAGGKLVPRMAVVGSLSRLRRFTKNLEVEPLPVARLYPPPGALEKGSFKPSFLLKGNHFRACYIYTTTCGWMKAKTRGNLVTLSQPVPLKLKRERVGVKCVNSKTGRVAQLFYLVLNQGAKISRRAGEREVR